MAKKILIIDDDPTNVALVSFLLKGQGYEIFVAGDGAQGMAQFASVQPDLIVLDVVMPGKDGFSFLTELKGVSGSIVPVVMLTSKEQFKELFKMEGISEYFVKPLNSEKFLATINKLLGKT